MLHKLGWNAAILYTSLALSWPSQTAYKKHTTQQRPANPCSLSAYRHRNRDMCIKTQRDVYRTQKQVTSDHRTWIQGCISWKCIPGRQCSRNIWLMIMINQEKVPTVQWGPKDKIHYYYNVAGGSKKAFMNWLINRSKLIRNTNYSVCMKTVVDVNTSHWDVKQYLLHNCINL